MKSLLVFLFAMGGTIGLTAAESEVVASYTTRLSARDHVNSDGARLQDAADIIQQDRANMHRWEKIDPEDESDGFFTTAERRALIPKMLERGSIGKGTRKSITTATPLVQIDVYRSSSGSYSMEVITLDE